MIAQATTRIERKCKCGNIIEARSAVIIERKALDKPIKYMCKNCGTDRLIKERARLYGIEEVVYGHEGA